MLGERLQELRKSRNMTQVEVAKELGVSKQSISNWENGNIQPSVDMLVKLSNLLSVQTDYLLGRSNDVYLQVEGLTADQIACVQQLIHYLQSANAEKDDKDGKD